MEAPPPLLPRPPLGGGVGPNLEFNVGHMCTAAADREWAGVILGWAQAPPRISPTG